MGKEGGEKERTKTVYERDSAGKLTLEAKFSLEKLDKEVVRREHKESKALRDAYEETFVNLDPEYALLVWSTLVTSVCNIGLPP